MKTKIITVITILFTGVCTLNAQIRVASSNNVGIGTDTPAEKLHINGPVRGNQSGALRISSGSSVGYIDVGCQNNCFAHFKTDRIQYYFDKRILINRGTLTSYGTSDLFLCTSSTPVTRITISNSNGNVGIGKSPHSTYKLDVAGDVASNGVKLTSDIRLKDNI